MAEKDVPKHGTGSNYALQLLYEVNTLPLQDLDSVFSLFCASKEDVVKGLTIPGAAEALNAKQTAFVFQVINRSLGIV